jgi:SEC-C motif-containing protein
MSSGSKPLRCPCGGLLPFDECCGRVHAGRAAAATAEALMRSRYSAFSVGDAAYLSASWHSSTRPSKLTLDPGLRWERLEIVTTTGGGLLHNDGTVEFRAHYRADGGARGVLHEVSRFVREDGKWTYLDGRQL